MRIAFKQIVWSYVYHLTLFEYISKDSIFTFFTVDVASMFSTSDSKELKTLDGKFLRELNSLTSTDIITYTYRF